MLLAALATSYLIVAFAIVLTVDRIAGKIFRASGETAPSVFRLEPPRFFRRASK